MSLETDNARSVAGCVVAFYETLRDAGLPDDVVVEATTVFIRSMTSSYEYPEEVDE